MISETWLDYVQSIDLLEGEFCDPVDKTRSIIAPQPKHVWERAFTPEWLEKYSVPTIIIDDYSVNDLDSMSEITLALEMLLRLVSNDYDEVTFGEPHPLPPVAATE